MEIRSSLDEIIDTRKKLKDADPAESMSSKIIVTVSIETNLRQGDVETEVDGTKGDLT